MNILNKKIFFCSLLLNSIVVYGDTLSTAIDLLDDKNKVEELENYGVITIGVEEFNIKPLYKNIEIQRGLAKRLDVQLFGYSIYTKTLSNYKDIRLVTPAFNKEKIGTVDTWNTLSFQYKNLKYDGKQIGNILQYTGQYRTESSHIDGGYGALELNYITMEDNDIKDFSKYYSFGLRMEYTYMQHKLIKQLSKKEKIPYGFDYSFFENAGCLLGYAWASGEHPDALFEGRYDYSKDGETNDPNEIKKHGIVYDFSYGPSVFVTFPIGYLQLQYYGTYSPLVDSFTTNGFRAKFRVIF